MKFFIIRHLRAAWILHRLYWRMMRTWNVHPKDVIHESQNNPIFMADFNRARNAWYERD